MWRRQLHNLQQDQQNVLVPLEDYYQRQQRQPQQPQSPQADQEPNGAYMFDDPPAADGNELNEEDDPGYEPVGLDSRANELQVLGKPDERRTCFGCVYVGERESGAVQKESLVEIMDMVTKSIGQVDPIVLAEEVARRYDVIRRETNASLLPGERPLPAWTAATVLEHFRFHHCTPTFKLWFALNDIREYQRYKEIAGHSMVELDKKTGRKRINKEHIKSYAELTKLEWQLAKIDPTKCTFHNGDSHMDLKSVSQGPINMSFKPMVAMLQRSNKRQK